jgi:hypothetical protein
MKNIHKIEDKLYITNSEKPKEGDWFIHSYCGITNIYKAKSVVPESIITTCDNGCWFQHCKKVILTDNKDLIVDGIQEISEDFLQWFVQNSDCEGVETKVEFIQTPDNLIDGFYYKTIIPQEDPKFEDSIENSLSIMSIANDIFGKKEYEIILLKKKFKQETIEKEPCNFCGKTLREQMKGCNEITCYRQFLNKQETLEEVGKIDLTKFRKR